MFFLVDFIVHQNALFFKDQSLLDLLHKNCNIISDMFKCQIPRLSVEYYLTM